MWVYEKSNDSKWKVAFIINCNNSKHCVHKMWSTENIWNFCVLRREHFPISFSSQSLPVYYWGILTYYILQIKVDGAWPLKLASVSSRRLGNHVRHIHLSTWCFSIWVTWLSQTNLYQLCQVQWLHMQYFYMWLMQMMQQAFQLL
jgi:hypothetical protein